MKAIPSVSMGADRRLHLIKLRIRKLRENRDKGTKRYKLGILKEHDTIIDLNRACRENYKTLASKRNVMLTAYKIILMSVL